MVHSSRAQHPAIAAQQQALLFCILSAEHIQVSAPFCACSSLLWLSTC